jgi:hypothetical protein
MGLEMSKSIRQQLFGLNESTSAQDNRAKRQENDDSKTPNYKNEKEHIKSDSLHPDWERTLKLIRDNKYEEALRELQYVDRTTLSTGDVADTSMSSPRETLCQVVRQRFFTAIRDDVPALASPYAVLYMALGSDPHVAAQYIHVQSQSLLTKRFEPLLVRLLAQLEVAYPSIVPSSPSYPSSSSSSFSSLLDLDPTQLQTIQTGRTARVYFPFTSSSSLSPFSVLSQLYTTVSQYQITHTYIGDTLGMKEAMWLMAHTQHLVERISLFVLHGLRVGARLDELVRDVTQFPLTSADFLTLTDVLDEFALISQHTEYYRLFLRKFYENGITQLREKGFSFVNDSTHVPSAKTLCIMDYVQEPTALFNLLDVLISCHYVPLEETFLLQNINRVLNEQKDNVRHCQRYEDNKTLSPIGLNREKTTLSTSHVAVTSCVPCCLDEIFLVCEKCAERALSTLNVSAGSHVTETLFVTLRGSFKETLLQHLKDSTVDSARSRLVVSSPHGLRIAFLLNTLSASTVFTATLRESLLTKLSGLFKADSDDRDKIFKLIAQQCALTVADFQQAFRSAVDMFVQFIQSQIHSSVVRFDCLDYNLDQAQYKTYEINDPWVEAFIHNVQEAIISVYRNHLSAEVWEEVIGCLLDTLLVEFERILMKKTYTHYGGLQLYNDFQQLFKYFSSLVKRSVRDKFTRVMQITSLLTLEKVNEVLDYWHTENMKWRLTSEEAKQVLRRRNDFNVLAIDRLKLETKAEQ